MPPTPRRSVDAVRPTNRLSDPSSGRATHVRALETRVHEHFCARAKQADLGVEDRRRPC